MIHVDIRFDDGSALGVAFFDNEPISSLREEFPAQNIVGFEIRSYEPEGE